MPGKPSKPAVLNLMGEVYVPLVLLIHTKNPDGSPALMKAIQKDHTIELAGGEEFMVVYAPKKMVEPERSNLSGD